MLSKIVKKTGITDKHFEEENLRALRLMTTSVLEGEGELFYFKESNGF